MALGWVLIYVMRFTFSSIPDPRKPSKSQNEDFDLIKKSKI